MKNVRLTSVGILVPALIHSMMWYVSSIIPLCFNFLMRKTNITEHTIYQCGEYLEECI